MVPAPSHFGGTTQVWDQRIEAATRYRLVTDLVDKLVYGFGPRGAQTCAAGFLADTSKV
jgi:hypothetical protein